MYDVDIYVDISSHRPQKMCRKYGCVLACTSARGEPVTMEIFGECEGTGHDCFIQAVTAALARMKKESCVHLHGSDTYVLGMIENYLETWAGQGFQGNGGHPLKNQEAWERLWELLEPHDYHVSYGVHEYTEWLRSELARKPTEA